MTKVARHSRYAAQPRKATGPAVVICKGVLVSLAVSLFAVLLLSCISLVSDGSLIEDYLRYIMVGITVVSIFCGSAFAAQRMGSCGLLIGVAVGLIYVLISLAFGMEIAQDIVTLPVMATKFAAGMAAGALGGLVGVNL